MTFSQGTPEQPVDARGSAHALPIEARGSAGEQDIDSETLFVRYARFVAAFLHRLGVRKSEVEDLVQEVFMTAHRKGGYRPGPASPTSYLAKLALEARLSTRRRERRWDRAHSEHLALDVIAVQGATPEQALALYQAAARMQCALDTMDPTTRAVFVLFELEGQSCESIAAGLELKLNTVYGRLHRGRKAFHAYVAALRAEDGASTSSPYLSTVEARASAREQSEEP
jgi:RNA polymerase sigma-70 factor (ECF subfamily)